MTMNMNCLSEWDRSLPSLDELTPLSQSLIPHELACAFNITQSSSTPTCTVTTPSVVLNGSQSAFESLIQMRSLLSPSVESNQKGKLETTFPSIDNTENQLLTRGVIKLPKSGSDSVQASEKGREGEVWIAGVCSTSAPGNYHGRVPGQGIRGGLSQLMSASSHQIGENLGRDLSHRKALLEDARGGSGRRTGGFILDASSFMQLKVDPSEEVDSGPSIDAFQSISVSMCNEEQSARTLKKPRLVWTPQLHKRFVDAVAHLGIKYAVPKTIMQLMNVDGLTRENVASHLQKYRIYLKRIQGLSSEGPSASDILFASTPVPASLTASPHFLVSHSSQHLDQAFGPVHDASLPGMLGHNAHHVLSHISTSIPSFSTFNSPPTFSSLARPPPACLEHVRDSYLQQSYAPSDPVLTLFPPSDS